MRARIVLLTVAALLLVASLASAATPAAADVAAALGQPAMSQLQMPACSASLAAPRPVPAGAAASPLTVPLSVCGTCSSSVCAYADFNQYCVINGTAGTCQAVLGMTCSDNVTFQCSCATGGQQ